MTRGRRKINLSLGTTLSHFLTCTKYSASPIRVFPQRSRYSVISFLLREGSGHARLSHTRHLTTPTWTCAEMQSAKQAGLQNSSASLLTSDSHQCRAVALKLKAGRQKQENQTKSRTMKTTTAHAQWVWSSGVSGIDLIAEGSSRFLKN